MTSFKMADEKLSGASTIRFVLQPLTRAVCEDSSCSLPLVCAPLQEQAYTCEAKQDKTTQSGWVGVVVHVSGGGGGGEGGGGTWGVTPWLRSLSDISHFLTCFCCQPIRNHARKLLSSNIDIAANHPDTLIESCYHRAYVPADQSETVFENCCYRTWGLVENRVINANC